MKRYVFPSVFWAFALCDVGASVAAADYPITPVSYRNVDVQDNFWALRLETNRRVTVWYDLQKCAETGRLANFAKAAGRAEGPFEGIYFNDSDVYKVIEGAAYVLAATHDPKLDDFLDSLIDDIAAAQEEDGYLYTIRTIQPDNVQKACGKTRWSHLAHSHELYNVGHLYEAAVAHFEATGKRSLLDVAVRNADLIDQTFGPGEGQLVDVPGHEEIEIGLARLYRATGEERYLKLAKFFLDIRGRDDRRQKLHGAYCQDHQPVVKQNAAVGHAVRAGYLYAAMADIAALTSDREYALAAEHIWNDVVSKKMYVTGGIGALRHGEGFGEPYALPNATAYNETCAAIAFAMWNHRMFLLTGDAKYIDLLERVLYNGFLSGVSLSGDTFFYPNPLASDGKEKFNHGAAVRSPWFGCSCCPVNVVRFVPQIPGYVYAVREEKLFVNLFVESTAKCTIQGRDVGISQKNEYPWDGRVAISISPDAPRKLAIHVRIPGWLRGKPVPSDLYRYAAPGPNIYSLKVNGEKSEPPIEKGYAILDRTWSRGDVIEIDMQMPFRRVLAHDNVAADRGRVAIQRGPIVYCVEGVDHSGDALDIVFPDDAAPLANHKPGLLGGVTVLTGVGQVVDRNEEGVARTKPIQFTAVPYYAWAHRGAGEMAVWMLRKGE